VVQKGTIPNLLTSWFAHATFVVPKGGPFHWAISPAGLHMKPLWYWSGCNIEPSPPEFWILDSLLKIHAWISNFPRRESFDSFCGT
jgi:hypothetical protein